VLGPAFGQEGDGAQEDVRMCFTYFVSRAGSMGGFFRANAIFTTPPAFGSMRTFSTLVTRLPGDLR
jgi:hypothetical protein